MTIKQQLIDQRKKINRSFVKQISQKDKSIHSLRQEVKLSHSAVLDLMDCCQDYEKRNKHLQASMDSLSAEFGKLKRKLKKQGEI